jgi:hypothetical protein
MRLDLIRPPRLGLLDPRVGRSVASWDITIGPVCAINVGCLQAFRPDPAVCDIRDATVPLVFGWLAEAIDPRHPRSGSRR